MTEKVDVPTASVVAPQQQQMFDTLLGDKTGVAVRQVGQVDEVLCQALCGCPCERANKYKVYGISGDKRAMHSLSDKEGWSPTAGELEAMAQTWFAEEESSFCERFLLGCLGCMNLRNLEMDFKKGEGNPAFSVSRICGLGGCCCCPFTSNVYFHSQQGKYLVGKVEQDMHCGKNYCLRAFQACFCFKDFYNFRILNSSGDKGSPQFTDAYQMEMGFCCCGPHLNCWGVNCICNDILFDIYPMTGKKVDKSQPAGRLQRTYGKDGGCTSFCRCCCGFSNYVVEFPPQASVEEKALFVAAFVNTDYVFFERTGA